MLAAGCEERAEYEQASKYARRLVEEEPLREDACRLLMRLLVLAGRRGEALSQYKACCRVLNEQLGVAPSAETTGLYLRIRDGHLGPESPSALGLPALVAFLHQEEAYRPPAFVAREQELARLGAHLDDALGGRGKVIFVAGEAGSGKTALIHEFARRAMRAHSDLVVADGSSNAHTGVGDPYLVFREVLDLLTGDVQARWAAGSISRDHARRLWLCIPHMAQALVAAGPDLVDAFVSGDGLTRRAWAAAPSGPDWVVQLAALASRKQPQQGPSAMDQSHRFGQYTSVLRTLSRRRPLLIALDDLQWADAGSASLLFHLGMHLEGSRILVIGAYRPSDLALGRPSGTRLGRGQAFPDDGARHPLEPVIHEFQRRFGDIMVDMAKADGPRFVQAWVDTEPNLLGQEFREALHGQAAGNPLFTTELLRTMQERGDLTKDGSGRWTSGPELDWRHLPAKVEGAIGERVDRLGDAARETLRVACVEGETFTAEAVAMVLGVSPRETVRQLSEELETRHRLVAAVDSQRVEYGRLSRYRFRHNLIQRYVYGGLDSVERGYLHEAVGDALEALHGQRAGEIAVQLARHYSEAGNPDKAVSYSLQAGKRAQQVSAHQEAIEHLTQGLAMIEALPESMGRDARELAVQVALALSCQHTQGYVATEAQRACARARELCEQVGDTAQTVSVLGFINSSYGIGGRYADAIEVGQQAGELALRAEEPLQVARARAMQGWVRVCMGEFDQARADLGPLISMFGLDLLSEPENHAAAATSVQARAWMTLALWFLGHNDQAVAQSQDAVAAGRSLGDAYSLTHVVGIAAFGLARFRRDLPGCQRYLAGLSRLSEKRGFIFYQTTADFWRGWLRAVQGEVQEGLAEMRRSYEIMRRAGTRAFASIYGAYLGEICALAGEVGQGLGFIDDALATVAETGEQFFVPGLYRVRGKLQLRGDGDECMAEQSFRRAIEIARSQNGRSLELQGASSLARLWHRQGRVDEAHQILQGIYGWFTEGFDTADLDEAKALLDALEAS